MISASPRTLLYFAAPLGLGETSDAEYMDAELLSDYPLPEIVSRLGIRFANAVLLCVHILYGHHVIRTGGQGHNGFLFLVRLPFRQFRRSGLEVAYSAGFNPHPLLYFAAPLGLFGVTIS